MNILALDPATKTGFAHSSGPSGVWDFNKYKILGDVIAVALTLRKKLDSFNRMRLDSHNRIGLDRVIYELPFIGKFASGGMAGVRLQTTIELWCRDNGIECVGVSPKTLKKHATGKGNATKLEVFKRAIKKWPDLDVKDDNHADARWLLDWAMTEYGG